MKIRGFRVELGEIESVLRLHHNVQDAVVVARDDWGAERRLVAYVTARGAEPVPVVELRDFVRQKLAPYMVPAAVVSLETFPLTPNGKIDRKALPVPDQHMPDTSRMVAAPRTPLEELLVGLWRDHLGLAQIGIHDNFFDLGGDSLSVIRLGHDIEQATGQSFALTRIFDAPTVAGMAEILSGQKAVAGYSPLVLLRPGDERAPMFLVHPIGGSTMQLLPIAKALPGQRAVYGIQARGFEGTEAPMDCVEAMAECYAAAIPELQPHGPYFLGGMCFGGLVAMEIARRLLDEGASIGLLALLDTYPHPSCWPLRTKIDYLGVRRVREAWAALRSARSRGLAGHARPLLEKVIKRFSQSEPFIRAPDSLPPAVRAVFDGGIAALAHYKPRSYPAKVHYLMCGYHAYLPDGPRSVWSHLVDDLEVCSVPMEELGRPSHPEYVAKWLSERMEGGPELSRPSRRPAYEPSETVAGADLAPSYVQAASYSPMVLVTRSSA